MFGRVRLYTLGFAVFTIGSALCSLSQSGLELVLFRMVQASGPPSSSPTARPFSPTPSR